MTLVLPEFLDHDLLGRLGRNAAEALQRDVLALALLVATPAAASDASPFDFDPPVPKQFQYAESYESRPPSFSFRRNQSRAVEAATRYRTSSILQYTTPLGETGLILRVKVPLKRHKIIKFEIRF